MRLENVRYWHLADIGLRTANVRLRGKADILPIADISFASRQCGALPAKAGSSPAALSEPTNSFLIFACPFAQKHLSRRLSICSRPGF